MNLNDFLSNPDHPYIMDLGMIRHIKAALGEEGQIICIRIRDEHFRILEKFGEASEPAEEDLDAASRESICEEGQRVLIPVFLSGNYAGCVEVVLNPEPLSLKIALRSIRSTINARVRDWESHLALEKLQTRLCHSQRQLERFGEKYEVASKENLTHHQELSEANQRLSLLIEEKSRLLDEALQRSRMFEILEGADFSNQQAFLEQCTRLLSDALKAEHSVIFRFSDRKISLVYAQGIGSLKELQIPGSNVILRAMETGRVIRLPADLWLESGIGAPLNRSLGMTADTCFACMVIPVERHEEKLGAVLLMRKSPTFQTEDESSARQIAGFLRSHLAIYDLIAAQMEAKLEIENLLNTIPDVVYQLDSNGVLRYISPSVSRWGWSSEDLIGRHFSCFVKDPDQEFGRLHILRKGPKNLINERRRGERGTRGLEIELVPGPGYQETYALFGEVNASGNWQRSKQDQPFHLGTIGIIRDVSMRRLAEENLAVAREEKSQLEGQLLQLQKMEIIGTLAGGIAHDFNNVLQPILGYSLLAVHNLDETSEVRRWMEHILTAARRARDLVKQILALSRRGSTEQRRVDLVPIIHEVLSFLRATVPSGIQLHTEIKEHELWVLGDPGQLHQVLMNLCTNACQAVATTGNRLLVTATRTEEPAQISSPSSSQRVSIQIIDNGPGMEERVMARIFEPFFTTKEAGKGTGLGLSVVHGIVNSHQGEIEVESTPGQGTTFTLNFPFANPFDLAAEESGRSLPAASGEQVLFVDDEEIILELGKEVLERYGYRVHTASSGDEALKAIQNGLVPNIVVTDHFMPGKLGSDLIREIRARLPEVPALMTTGNDHSDGLNVLEKIPRCACLMKPLDPEELHQAIHHLIHERK